MDYILLCELDSILIFHLTGSHELARHKRSIVKDFQCPSSYGYYRHPTTCNQYVWCVDSVPHLQECLGDNLFNYDIKRCDVPSKVGGCDGNRRRSQKSSSFKASPHSLSRNKRSFVKDFQCPSSYGYYRHPTTCNQYVWCVDSVPHLQECLGDNLFNYDIKRCDVPSKVGGCDGNRRRSQRSSSFKASPAVSRKRRSIVRGYQCPNSYGYFRHPTSCRQYIWCVDGIPNLMECNGGSVFDITIKRCNFPSQVKGCSGGDRRSEPERTPFSHLGLHPAGMEVEEPEYTCEGEEDGLWGHPKNCSIYFHCNRGKGTRFSCSPGTFFNPSTLVCSWPGEVHDCSEDGTVKDFYLRKRRSAYLKSTYTEDNERSARSTSILDDEPFFCPEKDGYYRHERNCSVYYRCTNNKPTRFECNPGTFYNPAMFGCSWPFQVIDCDSEGKLMPHRRRRSVFPEEIRDNHRSHGKDSELPFFIPEETYPCPITDGYYPHKKNCSVYFRCTQGKSTRFACNPGTFYNPSIFGCSWPDQVRDCDSEGNRRPLVKRRRRSIFSAPGQKDAPLKGYRCPFMDGYYRHPNDCTSYYWCVGRKPTKYSCANGTFFNPKMKLCTWPSQVTDCDLDGSRISHSPYQSRVKEFMCPREDGYYRHPTDCASYFRCNERKLTAYKCTPGTLFDAKNSVCAWPSQVHDCTETGEVIASSFINTPQRQANVDGKTDKNSTATTTATYSRTNKTKEETTFQTLPTKTTPAPATTTPTTGKARSTTAKTTKNVTSRVKTKVTSRVTNMATSRATSKAETSGTTSTTEATTASQNASTSTTTAPSTSTTSAPTTKTPKVTQRHSANDGFGHVINTDSKGSDTYKFGTSVQSPFACPDNEGYFSDMEDCASYYHCEHGVPYKKECGVGDFYSPLSQTCIPGHLVPDCNYDDDTPEDTTYPEWTKDYYKSYTSDFECPDLHGYFADDVDCTGYYECINGNAYHRKCNAGTYFDEKKEKCTWDQVSEKCPSAVKEDAVKETLGKMMKSGPFVCPSREGYFRDPKTCTMFYECKEGVPKSKSCGPETLFDDKKKKCTWPELVPDCDVYGRVIPSDQTLFSNKEPQQLEKNPNGFACPLPSGHFRDPRDCSIFYHCVKSVAYRGKCVNNHVFDLEALKCVDPELVPGCDVAPKVPLIEATTEETAHFDCPSDGYFREKSDCSVYYHCKDGVYFRHECKPNTVFSQEKGLCTWPHLVPGCEEKNDAPTVQVTSESMSEVAPPAEAQEPGSDYEFGESVEKETENKQSISNTGASEQASGPAGNDQEKPEVESETAEIGAEDCILSEMGDDASEEESTSSQGTDPGTTGVQDNGGSSDDKNGADSGGSSENGSSEGSSGESGSTGGGKGEGSSTESGTTGAGSGEGSSGESGSTGSGKGEGSSGERGSTGGGSGEASSGESGSTGGGKGEGSSTESGSTGGGSGEGSSGESGSTGSGKGEGSSGESGATGGGSGEGSSGESGSTEGGSGEGSSGESGSTGVGSGEGSSGESGSTGSGKGEGSSGENGSIGVGSGEGSSGESGSTGGGSSEGSSGESGSTGGGSGEGSSGESGSTGGGKGEGSSGESGSTGSGKGEGSSGESGSTGVGSGEGSSGESGSTGSGKGEGSSGESGSTGGGSGEGSSGESGSTGSGKGEGSSGESGSTGGGSSEGSSGESGSTGGGSGEGSSSESGSTGAGSGEGSSGKSGSTGGGSGEGSSGESGSNDGSSGESGSNEGSSSESGSNEGSSSESGSNEGSSSESGSNEGSSSESGSNEGSSSESGSNEGSSSESGPSEGSSSESGPTEAEGESESGWSDEKNDESPAETDSSSGGSDGQDGGISTEVDPKDCEPGSNSDGKSGQGSGGSDSDDGKAPAASDGTDSNIESDNEETEEEYDSTWDAEETEKLSDGENNSEAKWEPESGGADSKISGSAPESNVKTGEPAVSTGSEKQGGEETVSKAGLVSETETKTGGELMQGDTGFVCPPVIDGFYGDPIYCQRFYRCVGDKKYSFTCPSGTFFDNGRFICNFKEKVSECTSSGLRISQAGNDAPEEVDEPMMVPEVSAVVTAEPVPPCPESDGLFPHPSSCSKFLYCARFSAMVLTCPKDLAYNMEKKTCDYSDNVVCIRYD
ncbi:uncharacterized protein LOC124137847 isoform X4 [Haliotis rufescens]|uniref:uncharacterized protein LOC124137847 isoform X4 n=1 Tax=Haliotis rufescens TaxID=6454 RepID=UPI00201F6255|nr:uncharacterized protein LOC124137847 isoform X4 [Haliotis rufescens]